jgi:hypothetical protein
MLALGAIPGVVIGLNPSGRAKYLSERTGKTFHTPYGWPIAGGGAPDIIAIVAPLGRAVCLEVKTGDATTTPAQRACLDALRACGAVVAVVRSVEEARAALDASRQSGQGAETNQRGDPVTHTRPATTRPV